MAATHRVAGETKRLGHILLLTTVACWIPMGVCLALLGGAAATMLIFGSLLGLVNTLTGGRRIGLAAGGLFVLVTPVAVMAGQDPLAGACLVALGSLFIGTTSRWPRFSGFSPILVGILFVMALPASVMRQLDGGPSQSRYLFAILIGTAVCAFWPVLVAPHLTKVTPVPASLVRDHGDVVRYTAALTILTTAAAFYALEWGASTNGVWLPLTFVMVLSVQVGGTRHRSWHRIWGTIAGALLASVLATVAHGSPVLYVFLALAFLGLLATMGREPYALFAFFLTLVLMLAFSFGEPVLEVSAERVAYTLLGSAISLALVLLKERVESRVQLRTAATH